MQFARTLFFISIFCFAASSLATAQDLSDLTINAAAKANDKENDAKAKSSNNNDKKSDEKKSSEPKKKPEQKEPKKPQLRQISLSGNYVDLVQPMSFDPMTLVMGGNPIKQKSFYRLCKFVDDMAGDDRFSYVVIDLSASQLTMNSAQLDEFSRYLKKLSDSGKRTFAWLEDASNVHLSIAASCDEVIMADLGGVDMPSVAMQSMFYRDAMDLVGVKASVVRAGDFKGAVEPYTNAKMSDHLREHYLAMLTSMNDAMIDRIARGRGLKHAQVRELQGQRMLLPQAALAAGLVDQLAPYGAMQKAIKDEIGEEIDWVTPKTAAKTQMSVFQLMGQMMSGPPTSSGRLRENTIAVLHLSGAIVPGKKAVPGSIVSGPTVDLIEKMIEEDKVKGAVVRINSPGGSASASEAVRQALLKLSKKKPTMVSMGNMAASGGYWISCIDAPIYAEKGTITGSIGVFSMKLSVGALMRRVGVHLESITLDESAKVFSLDHAWSDKDAEVLQKTIDLVYGRFLDLVSEKRGIKEKKVRKIAGGRVWSGAQAKKLKLVDHIGGLDDCLAAVSKKTKLDKYNVIHRPIARSGLDLSDLLGSTGEEEIWSDVSEATIRILRQRGFSLDLVRLLVNDALTSNGRPTTWLLNPVELSIR